MTTYQAHVKGLQSTFEDFNICQIPKLQNNHEDALANLDSTIPVTASQAISAAKLSILNGKLL